MRDLLFLERRESERLAQSRGCQQNVSAGQQVSHRPDKKIIKVVCRVCVALAGKSPGQSISDCFKDLRC